MEEYIKLLELPEKFDIEDLKMAYRKKILIYHPDKATNEAERIGFDVISKRLNEAYECLKEYLEKHGGVYTKPKVNKMNTNSSKDFSFQSVKDKNFTQLNMFCSVVLSMIIGLGITFILAFVFQPVYTKPLIYTCLFSYTTYPLCRCKFNFTYAYKKQNIFFRFIIGFVLFGLIFGLSNLGNSIKQTSQNSQVAKSNITQKTNNSKEKSILDFYNAGNKYCSHSQLEEGTSSFHFCVIKYIKNNASSEINIQLKNIQQYCEYSTNSNVDYKNCIDQTIHKVSE